MLHRCSWLGEATEDGAGAKTLASALPPSLSPSMFLSPFTVSLACDAGVIVVYLQRAENFGGTPWFSISLGRDYASEMVDVVRALCCCVRDACPSWCSYDSSAMWHGNYCYLDYYEQVQQYSTLASRNEAIGRNFAVRLVLKLRYHDTITEAVTYVQVVRSSSLYRDLDLQPTKGTR